MVLTTYFHPALGKQDEFTPPQCETQSSPQDQIFQTLFLTASPLSGRFIHDADSFFNVTVTVQFKDFFSLSDTCVAQLGGSLWIIVL